MSGLWSVCRGATVSFAPHAILMPGHCAFVFCRFIAINAVIMWLLIAIAGPVDISRSVRMGSPVRLIRTAISGDLPARASFSKSAPIRSYLAPCLLVLNLLDWQCNVPEDANHGSLGNDGTAFCDLE